VSDTSDPRVFFAAERTLLAWIRTGLTVIGLGFVVARFGLFLRLMSRSAGTDMPHAGSTALGVGLVLLGSAAVATAAWQHLRFCRGLSPTERFYWAALSVLFGICLAGVGVALAVYLLVRANAA
jgi:putative membrane protein